MDYPNNFNIPAFPAGKTIAFSRSVSIWILIVFFLIIAACGFILLNRHFKTNYPFLISVDPFTDEWNLIAYPKEKQKPVSQHQIIQEKLVNDYIVDWFTISPDIQANDYKWQKCSVEECSDPLQFNPNNTFCALSCKSSPEVFDEFAKNVFPQYRAMIEQAGETWSIVSKQIIPIVVLENASKWQVYITIKSGVVGFFNILTFVDIARDTEQYPATFGYYVNQFNSYRVTQ